MASSSRYTRAGSGLPWPPAGVCAICMPLRDAEAAVKHLFSSLYMAAPTIMTTNVVSNLNLPRRLLDLLGEPDPALTRVTRRPPAGHRDESGPQLRLTSNLERQPHLQREPIPPNNSAISIASHGGPAGSPRPPSHWHSGTQAGTELTSVLPSRWCPT